MDIVIHGRSEPNEGKRSIPWMRELAVDQRELRRVKSPKRLFSRSERHTTSKHHDVCILTNKRPIVDKRAHVMRGEKRNQDQRNRIWHRPIECIVLRSREKKVMTSIPPTPSFLHSLPDAG